MSEDLVEYSFLFLPVKLEAFVENSSEDTEYDQKSSRTELMWFDCSSIMNHGHLLLTYKPLFTMEPFFKGDERKVCG